MHISARQRKLAKWLGYPLLALFTFVFALAYTFPYDRLQDKIVEQLSDKYDVSIASIEPTLVPGTFTINMMTLRTRPKTPEEKPVTVVVKEVEVNVGITSAIFWSMDMAKLRVDIEAQMGSGTLELAAEHDRGDNTVFVEAKLDSLPIASIPGVAEAVGLPMTGALNADLAVSLPKAKWSKADGKISFNCVGCTVGDGVAKMSLKPPPSARKRSRKALFQSEGLTVPRIQLGSVRGDIRIKKGKGEIKSMSAKSKDGFLAIEGELVFKDPFRESLFPGCMTFGFSEDLKNREPKFMAIQSTLPPKSKQSDGSYSLPTKGKLVELRFDIRKQCGEKGASRTPSRGTKNPRSRPRITTSDRDRDKSKAADRIEPRTKPLADNPVLGEKTADGATGSGPKLSAKEKAIKPEPDEDEDEDVESDGEEDDDDVEDDEEEEDEDADDEDEDDDEDDDDL